MKIIKISIEGFSVIYVNLFRSIMQSIANDDRVISLVSIPGLPAILENLQDQLARCQRALNKFLEVCKSIFMHKICYIA